MRCDIPYIKRTDRERLEDGEKPLTAGELNYSISQLVIEYLGVNPNYQAYNDVVGVLECLKLEIANRSLFPYEREKAQLNGDLFWPNGDRY